MGENKAVFLDRDGVINPLLNCSGELRSPSNPEEFEFFPRVGEAIEKAKDLGFKVIVVSNQPDVAKGRIKKKGLKEITQKVEEELKVDGVYYCTHRPPYTPPCRCRKPKPGLFEKAFKELDVDLEESYVIGDRQTDMRAGRKCKTKILIKREHTKEDGEEDYTASSLFDAVKKIWSLENENIH